MESTLWQSITWLNVIDGKGGNRREKGGEREREREWERGCIAAVHQKLDYLPKPWEKTQHDTVTVCSDHLNLLVVGQESGVGEGVGRTITAV